MKFYGEVGFVYFGDIVSDYEGTLPAGSRLMTADEVRAFYPYLEVGADSPQAVLARRQAGYIDARLYIRAQLSVARRQGCQVVDGVVARVSAGEGGRGLLVETEAGARLLARKVLLCTGGFTAFKDLLASVGRRRLDAVVTSDVTVRFQLDAEGAHRLRDMPCMSSSFIRPSPRECYILPPITYPDGKIFIVFKNESKCLGKLHPITENTITR